ncbi:MAG: hypothetical protein MN733_35860 [Nitrososphaera sp.]|nr:hypothetical protein [Nitrososphaera sp.]
MIHLSQEEHAEKFSDLCDAVCRIFFTEQYGINEDELRHTSAPARAAAAAAMEALEEYGAISTYD